ncbi:MAG: RHS repeat protein, partial [Myxococcales bacterium]|nr:RHS repeat protein [Myxococcales bacterium]
MPRTAPAPNMVAIPGMNPGTFVAGGGGDGGGGSGGKGGGRGRGGAGGGSSGREDARGGGKEAPDPSRYPVCGSKSHPVDVVTGRAYTHPIEDFSLGGPLPLVFRRVCSSKIYNRDLGLGPSWAHTLGWRLKVDRRAVRVFTEQGTVLDMPIPRPGETVTGPWGWRLRRDSDRQWSLDTDEAGLWRHFHAVDGELPWCFLTAIEDRNHNRIELGYHQQQLTTVQDSAGRLIQVRCDAQGRLESMTAVVEGAAYPLVSYRYDDRGCLVEVIDADGFASRYEYDERGRMIRDTDRTGLAFHFVYDQSGRCVESWGAYPGRKDPSLVDDVPDVLADGVTPAKGVHHCVFEYWPDGGSQVCDSTTSSLFEGNARGTVEQWCDGPNVWNYSYDDEGFLVRQEDPMGGITQFERDERGRLLAVTDPLGRRTQVRRDASGLPVHVVDPEGAETRVSRDLRGNIETIQDAAEGLTSFRRDERGLIVEARHANGGVSSFTYDAAGNLISRRDPSGAEWRYAYDALGRRTAVIDPLGAETRYRYSARGDLTELRDASGGVTRYTYDGERRVTEIVDPGGRTTRFEWGGYHRLCARTDANGNTVRLGYNREGELVQVVNEQGQVHQFEYDLTGRLIGEQTFDGRRLHYRLDGCGRPVRLSSPSSPQAVEYEYDLAGQLIRRIFPADGPEEFSYDGRGALVSAKNAAGEFRFERDAVGRVIREVQVLAPELLDPELGDAELTLTATYDALGNRKSRQTSLGHSEAIERDLSGRRTRTVLDGSVELSHQSDLLGREIVRELPGGAALQSEFDALGRLTARRIQAPGHALARAAGEPEWLTDPGTLTYGKRYEYDRSSELVAVWDRHRGPTRYEYDRVGQLLASLPSNDNTEATSSGAPPPASAPAPASEERFSYDAAGNLYDAAGREYDAGNQLLRRGNVDYCWNADGQLWEKHRHTPFGVEVTRYLWNDAGQLRTVELPDGRTVSFAYDPFARRVHKRVEAPPDREGRRAVLDTTRFFWDGQRLVHELTRRSRPDHAGAAPRVAATTAAQGDPFAGIASPDPAQSPVEAT